MVSSLKKSNNNSNKSIANDLEAAVEADTTLTCTSKSTSSIRKTKLVIPKGEFYSESFLQYGFTFILENNKHRLLCLICNKVLASDSLKQWLSTFFSSRAKFQAFKLYGAAYKQRKLK